jgi:hypothetical protein
MIENAEDVAAEYSSRLSWYAGDHAVMDKLVNAYFGVLPAEFNDYFDPEMHVHVINMLRMAWDDLAIRAGKTFRVTVRPDNDSDTARARAEKQEKIGYWYNEAGGCIGGIGRDMVQKVQAWWMVGCANAVYLTLPSYQDETPFITFRDPRTYFPPAGWTPYSQAPADDGIFAYQMTLGELRRRYPDAELEVSQKFGRRSTGYGSASMSRNTDETQVWVNEFYSPDSWMVVALGDSPVTLVRTDTGDRGHPDVNPIVPVSLYNPSGAKGRSFLADQVSIQAALARMFSQKLDFYDRTLYPIVFHTRLMGQTLRIGPYATNEFDASDGTAPKVEVVAPAHQIDADQTMNFALGLSRMLNRNPESFQGQGQADSAKAIDALESGVTATIRDDFWPPMLAAEPRIMENCAKLDVNLWPGSKKNAEGKRNNRPYAITYTPTVDLRGREKAFRAQPGYGTAGYRGVIEILQMLGAEQIDELSAIEQRPDVEDADEMLRRINMDRLAKLERLQLSAAAQIPPGTPGALQDGALAKLKQLIAKGKSWDEAVEELTKMGQLTVPPPPPPPEAAGLPGLGGLGGGAPAIPTGPGTGGAASELPLPLLSSLRGGPGGLQGHPAPTA